MDETRACCPAQGALVNVMWQPGWEGSLGRMDTCIRMAESLRCSPETITTLLADYESESEAAQSCPTLCDPTDCSPPGSSVRGIFQPIVLDTDCHFLLQGIFPTQASNPGLPHCRQMLYRLSQLTLEQQQFVLYGCNYTQFFFQYIHTVLHWPEIS